MPRFYEEAAHLLFVMMAHGLSFAPGTDHTQLLERIADLLDRCARERPTHADAAGHLFELASAVGMQSMTSRTRTRMVALAGTMIGNLMTMNHR